MVGIGVPLGRHYRAYTKNVMYIPIPIPIPVFESSTTTSHPRPHPHPQLNASFPLTTRFLLGQKPSRHRRHDDEPILFFVEKKKKVTLLPTQTPNVVVGAGGSSRMYSHLLEKGRRAMPSKATRTRDWWLCASRQSECVLIRGVFFFQIHSHFNPLFLIRRQR